MLRHAQLVHEDNERLAEQKTQPLPEQEDGKVDGVNH